MMIAPPNDKPNSVTFLPYVRSILNCISRVLFSYNIKSAGLLPRKISGFLQPVKNDMGLRTPGVYSIPCECCKFYIKQTGCSIYIKLKKHHWHIQLKHLDKSDMTEHSINLKH
jgi:hypothetical protein